MISNRKFHSTVYRYYNKHGRHHLPWRTTYDPYLILVSEIMLQQTQVDRVIPKYITFLVQFPTIETLAHASLGEVLRAWQGLGYNRRAKMLHDCAQFVVTDWGGILPWSFEELKKLPGIGPYTAGAVMSFAYNQPVTMIETNIRTVYLHHFFPDVHGIHDDELLPLITRTVDREHPRRWYAALMDYGTFLKKTVGNISRTSAHHTQQTTFKGSNREVRGAIIRHLSSGPATQLQMEKTTGLNKEKIIEQLHALTNEGMLSKKRSTYTLK